MYRTKTELWNDGILLEWLVDTIDYITAFSKPDGNGIYGIAVGLSQK